MLNVVVYFLALARAETSAQDTSAELGRGWFPGMQNNRCIFGQWCYPGLRCEHLLGGEGSVCVIRERAGGFGELCIHGYRCNPGLMCVNENQGRVCRYRLYGEQSGQQQGSTQEVTGRLGSSMLGHPASHAGAPTVSGLTDSNCPHNCAIWAWDTSRQDWVKDCVSAGWTVDGAYTYPSPTRCNQPVTCTRVGGPGSWTQWCCGTC